MLVSVVMGSGYLCAAPVLEAVRVGVDGLETVHISVGGQFLGDDPHVLLWLGLRTRL